MTTHLYTLGGPPDAIGEAISIPWVAEALDHEDLQAMAATEAGRLGDLGIPNHNSAGVLTVRHTSRLVYQGQGKSPAGALTSGESK